MYTAEKQCREQIWYNRQNAKKTNTFCTESCGESELQIQSKQCSACRGLELVKKIVSVLLLKGVW